MTNGDILEGQWPWTIVVNPEGCDGIRGSRRRQWMRLHQTKRRRQSIVVPRQQLHIALQMYNVGLLCWRASSTRLQPRHQEARWQRWAAAGVVAGIVNENGASQHRPIRRQPSASASRPWAATSDEALQAPKTTSTCTPTNPQPPKGSQPKEKKATKKGMPCTALFVLTKGHPQRSKNSPHSATQQAPSFCRRCMQLPSRIVVLVR